MNRLTEKNGIFPRDMMNAEYAKLADLEDIEEELGIDLITLFKALDSNNTIYVKDKNKIVEFDKFISGNRICNSYQLLVGDYYDNEFMYLDFKDYGETWSLVKEDLTK